MNPYAMKARAGTPMYAGIVRPSRVLSRMQAENVKRAYSAPMYDTATFASVANVVASGQSLSFFTQGLGQGVSPVFGVGTKTETDTNIRTSGGQLSLKQTFLAKEFGAEIFFRNGATAVGAGAFQDAQAFLYAMNLIYQSGTTAIPLGVLADWPGGSGVAGAGAAIAAVPSNGWQTSGARKHLSIEIVFAGGEDLRLIANNPQIINTVLAAQTWVLKLKYWGEWADRVS